MYKGQFAKWKWTKYNKSHNAGTLKPLKSRVTKKKRNGTATAARRAKGTVVPAQKTEGPAASDPDPNPHPDAIPQTEQYLPLATGQTGLFYFNEEDFHAESTLNAYAVLISHWSQSDRPWGWDGALPGAGERHGGGGGGGGLCLALPRHNSILQDVRAAQDHFARGRMQAGGDVLRRAFLGIEVAVAGGTDVEAIWDCCLGVPQLALAMGWTDVLRIFAAHLHRFARIRLPGTHPLTRIAANLDRLARNVVTGARAAAAAAAGAAADDDDNDDDGDDDGDGDGDGDDGGWRLQHFVARAWGVWIDCVSRVRGEKDDVTIHLKRGFVTLVDPCHAMARGLIADFCDAVQASLDRRGAAETTCRILALEHLLVRMFVPLFTPESARRTWAMLTAVVERIRGRPCNRGRPQTEWNYMDRYMVFSAYYFLAAVAARVGDEPRAAEFRRCSLDSPRDLFWTQTALLTELRLRAEGNCAEADLLMRKRVETHAMLGLQVASGKGDKDTPSMVGGGVQGDY